MRILVLPRRVATVACLLSLAAAPSAAQGSPLALTDFDWTLTGETTAGSGSIAGETMIVVSPDGSCGLSAAAVWFETVAPSSGVVTVTLDWTSVDVCHYDHAVTVLDSDVSIIPPIGGGTCYGYSDHLVTFEVSVGQTFGIGAGTADCIMGPGTATYTSFSFTPAPSAFWIDLQNSLDPRLLTTIEANTANAQLGQYVALPGDVDGDGVVDVALTIPQQNKVSMRSGKTGAVIWEAQEGFAFGRGFATPGDTDGDGIPDLVTVELGADEVHMLGGDDGILLWSWQPMDNLAAGWSLSLMNDLDADGIDDLVVAGHAFQLSEARVSLLSGADGSEILSFTPTATSFEFGFSVSSAGDLDNDGVDDVIVGSPAAAFPAAHVYSGADGSELFELTSPSALQFPDFGAAVAGARDINGDGVPDLLVSSPTASDDQAVVETGAVLLYNGADGTLEQTIFGAAAGEQIGTQLLGGLDINNDGVREMAFTNGVQKLAGGSNPGGVSVRRTVGGQALLQLTGSEAGGQFGFGLAAFEGLGGTSQLAVGAPSGDSGGQVTLWHKLLHPGAPRLVTSGTPVPGMTWTLSVENGPGDALAGLVLGASTLNAGFKGGILVPALDQILLVTLDNLGTWSVGGIWPASVPPQIPIWIQAWVADSEGPFGYSATNAVQTAQL